MIPKGIKGTASWFWAATPPEVRQSRDIERAIPLVLPLAIVKLPRLSISNIADWMSHHGSPIAMPVAARSLRGGLLASGGHGIAFVDGSDDPEEIRFTLAHEAAHFVLHYLLPRRELIAVIGPSAVEILDSERQPTVEERLAFTFAGISIGEYRLLLERGTHGQPNSPAAMNAEIEADLLTFELLAPKALLMARLRRGGIAQEILRDEFGFPSWAADAYGRTAEAEIKRRKNFWT